jgi:2-oxoglutarate dehydrogenase E1 component
VAYCTTAAQHFHILRRQMHRSVRKPLILMTPKSHLRSKQASSDFSEFVSGRFLEIIGDRTADPAKVKRLVITCGKIYHELAERRDAEKADHVALVRIEQLYPLHEELLMKEVKPFLGAKDVVWCQEEPQNQGAWHFIEPELRRILGRPVAYAGREAAASPAPGSMALFLIEQEQVISSALGVAAKKIAKAH